MEWLHGMGKILLGQGEEREVWTGEHILGILGDGVTFYGENGTFFLISDAFTGIRKTNMA